MIKTEQEKRDKKIVEAYLSGEKVRSLASYFGLSTQQINNVLNKNKVKRHKNI